MKFNLAESIVLRDNTQVQLRSLAPGDAGALGCFFDSLGDETRSRFGPHPLNTQHAQAICDTIEQDRYQRILAVNGMRVEGYFLLGFTVPIDEIARYADYQLELQHGRDLIFAPCILDEVQNTGLASAAMPAIIDHARQIGSRSLVLLGGTQAPNLRAVHFYQKFGFVSLGTFQSHVENIDMWLPLSEGK